MITLYLIRHGQTDWNKEGRIQGHLDVHLNDQGRLQAKRLAPLLRAWNVDFVATSDLSRAHETARLAAPDLCTQGLIHVEERFREVHLGALQGKTREEISRDHGIEFSRDLHSRPLSDADIVKLGSEHGATVVNRVVQGIQESLRQAPSNRSIKRIAIISHGGVIRRLLAHAHPENLFPPPVGNGAVYPVEYDELSGGMRLLHSLEIIP